MSEFESAFLCGILEKFKPKKILEVGVAAGGTTAIILQCLEKIGQKYEMHSVDIAEKFYRDNQKQSGFLAEDTKNSLSAGTHEFYLGTTAPFVLDKVGREIDFVILDTMHVLPGEILDFLAVLPYLKDDAVVCMHDVSLNQTDWQSLHSHATGALFSAVTAHKFLNFILADNLQFRYPNIAAFQIIPDTMKYIENVFLTLILRWRYFPGGKDLKAYAESFARNYPQELFLIFQEAIQMNYRNLAAEIQANQR